MYINTIQSISIFSFIHSKMFHLHLSQQPYACQFIFFFFILWHLVLFSIRNSMLTQSTQIHSELNTYWSEKTQLNISGICCCYCHFVVCQSTLVCVSVIATIIKKLYFQHRVVCYIQIFCVYCIHISHQWIYYCVCVYVVQHTSNEKVIFNHFNYITREKKLFY